MEKLISTASWDSYWRGDQSSHAYSSAGVNHEDITAWWSETFKQILFKTQSLKMLDVATGNGALPEIALSHWLDGEPNITATDISAAAIKNIATHFPRVKGVVADALDMPFKRAEFDLITSQFGIEYAGVDAIDSVVPLLADKGTLILMMHIDQGQIHQDCVINRDGLAALKESKFISLAHAMLEHGFAAVMGADRLPYDRAAEQLAMALPLVEHIIDTYGVNVAGGSIHQLYNDIGTIHSKLPNYKSEEVLQWLTTMEKELDSYINRMQTMIDAAIDQARFERICEKLVDAGFTLLDNAALFDKPSHQPLAWIIRAVKT